MTNATATIRPDNTTLEERATFQAEQADASELNLITDLSLATIQKAAVFNSLRRISDRTGGYVRLLPELSYLPVLIGRDGEPVYLFEIVDSLDRFVDFDAILERHPTLLFSQVAGAISFLRHVAQINTSVDIDCLEEEFDLNEVRQAFEQIGDVADVFVDAV